jgi:hypothetical protein
MDMRSLILEALASKYEGQIQEARANIEIYLSNPAGIGEHSDIISAVDCQVTKIAEAAEKKEMLVWFD